MIWLVLYFLGVIVAFYITYTRSELKILGKFGALELSLLFSVTSWWWVLMSILIFERKEK